MKTLVRTTFLEMRARQQLRPKLEAPTEVVVLRAMTPSPELNRYLYTSVGGDHHWQDRLEWSWGQWMEWLDRPDHETWVMYWAGTPAGYFELDRQGSAVELAYFGLLPAFAGRRLGGYLLTQAVDRAWTMVAGVDRVWVHTCTLDHPAALANYLARGFSIYREEETTMELSKQPPGPWAGAERPR